MSNTVTVYSPQGEPFELSNLNARDLVNHTGWSYKPPVILAAPAPAEAPAPAAPVTPPPAPTAPVPPVAPVDAPKVEETKPAEAPKVRETTDDFADLVEKTDVAAYIKAAFPEATVDGRSNREKLVEQAIELAKA